jgi:CRP-like cAMP-binding protein
MVIISLALAPGEKCYDGNKIALRPDGNGQAHPTGKPHPFTMSRNHAPDVEILKSIPLFQSLTPPQHAHLHALMEYRFFRAGEFVIKQGNHGNSVFFLHQGTMKVRSIIAAPLPHSGKREMILRLLGKGAVMGELRMLDGGGHTADVVALEPSSCFVLPVEHFQRMLETYPPFQSAFMRHVAFYTRYASARHEVVSLHSVVGAVAAQLVILGEELGEPQPGGDILLPVPLTQSILAGLTGHSRESVNKTIKRFQNSGWLAPQARHRMLLQDMASLKRTYLTALPHSSG